MQVAKVYFIYNSFFVNLQLCAFSIGTLRNEGSTLRGHSLMSQTQIHQKQSSTHFSWFCLQAGGFQGRSFPDLIEHCLPSLLDVPLKLSAGMITEERPGKNLMFVGKERFSRRNMLGWVAGNSHFRCRGRCKKEMALSRHGHLFPQANFLSRTHSVHDRNSRCIQITTPSKFKQVKT